MRLLSNDLPCAGRPSGKGKSECEVIVPGLGSITAKGSEFFDDGIQQADVMGEAELRLVEQELEIRNEVAPELRGEYQRLEVSSKL